MTETPDEPVFVTITATCRTEACDNAGIPITLSVPDEPNPHIVCGVCGQPITETT